MSSAAGAPQGLSLDTGGLWRHRARQRSRALVRTYLLSSASPPLPPAMGARLRDPLRLPSLAAAKAPHRQTTAATLSISEPSLFTPGERAVFDGFSQNRRPPPRRRPSPLPLRKSRDTGAKTPSQSQTQIHIDTQKPAASCRPIYTHFSQPIRPNPKLAVKPGSQSLTLNSEQGELRTLVLHNSHSSQGEALSVRGKPCLPRSLQPSPPAAAPAATRTQLHIFLPTDGGGEGQEVDSESVDEGFMDELDSKITSLKIQQGASLSKLHTHPD